MTFLGDCFLGIGGGDVGAYKVQAYPKVWGRLEGTSLKVFPPQKTLQNKGVGAPIFWGISPKLLVALRGIHPYLSTPILPRGQGKRRPQKIHQKPPLPIPRQIQRTYHKSFLRAGKVEIESRSRRLTLMKMPRNTVFQKWPLSPKIISTLPKDQKRSRLKCACENRILSVSSLSAERWSFLKSDPFC